MPNLLLAASLVLAVGCGSARPVHRGTVDVTSAELVALDVEVQTLADADQPVFVAHGRYWLFHDGRWWRSATLGDRWTLEPDPPTAIQQIDQPYAYTHYVRTNPGARTTPARPALTSPSATAVRPRAPAPVDEPAPPPNTTPTDPSIDPTLNLFAR